MNKELILSIVIPTYGRVKFLETTVNLFIAQIVQGGFENEVEIVIGDDASPDETATYLNTLEKKYPFIRPVINIKNLGVSGNVEKIITLARGKFIWGFGEDDLITKNALKKVLDSIKMDDPNIILLNTINITSLDDKNLNYKLWGHNRLDMNKDIFITSFKDEKDKLAPVKKWFYLSNLISAVVFRKELFLAGLPETKKYLRAENVYLFQGPIIIGIATRGRLKLMADRLVLHRKNENHWSGKTEGLFRINLYDASEAIRLVKAYLPSEYKDYQKIFAVHTFTTIKRAKQQGKSITNYILDSIKEYYSCFPYSLRFFIALLTPGVVFRIYQRLRKTAP